jgi:hypothetical protein
LSMKGFLDICDKLNSISTATHVSFLGDKSVVDTANDFLVLSARLDEASGTENRYSIQWQELNV